MRVIHIISSLGRGGKERQLFELLKGLKEDIELSLIILGQDLAYPVEDLEIEVLTLDKNKRKWPDVHRAVMTYVRKLKPDVIHYWDALSSMFAMEARLLYRIKSVDGSIRYAGKLGGSMPQKALRSLRFRLADRIVANSEAGLCVEGLLNSSKASVIHNGIDLSRFKIDSGFSAQAIGLDNNHIKIAMVAGFRPAKDHATFIKSAAELCSLYGKLQFILVGDGENRIIVQQPVPSAIREKVLFLGNRTDVEQILLRCDIGVLLNNTKGHAEGLSNSIMEYMAAGLPVVATNAGGTPELVKDGETGYLVESFNVAQVVDRLGILIESPELRRNLGEAGRQHIQSDLSLVAMLDKHMKLYQSLSNHGLS